MDAFTGSTSKYLDSTVSPVATNNGTRHFEGVLPWVYLVLSGVLSTFNGIFILVFLRSSTLQRSAFFKLAFSMSIADQIQLLEFIVYSCPSSIRGETLFGSKWDPVFGFISNSVWFTSTATLFCQAVNRFFAVRFPALVDSAFSKRNGNICIFSSWMVGFCLTCLNINPDGYLKWNVLYSAWLYENSAYGFVDLGYTCTLLTCVFLLHGMVFYMILKHDKAKSVKSQNAEVIGLRKREVKQFLQFFFITLFPLIYEIVGNILPNVFSTLEAMEAFNTLNTLMLILDAGANGFTYVMANETVREDMLTYFPAMKVIFRQKKKSKVGVAWCSVKKETNAENAETI